MSTTPFQRRTDDDPESILLVPSDARKRLKRVPDDRAMRERIRDRAIREAQGFEKSTAPARHAIEAAARRVLVELKLSESYVGWTMVAVSSAFWQDEIERIPTDRRLLLLPHCLRHAEKCRAQYDAIGLQCENCGLCSLTKLRDQAQQQGYRVLIAEGSPVVMQIILTGRIDAVLGVACLNSLEKAFDKVMLAGLPSMAVPLLTDACRDTRSDEDWIHQMIDTPYRPGRLNTQTQVHLLRRAAGLFEQEQLDRLVPRTRGGLTLEETNGRGLSALDPIATTEAIARDFLLSGGKHYRPFITLAAYDAMTGGQSSGPNGDTASSEIPDAVCRIALAIEVFHKASLIHDDIEDDDLFRYGRATVHRKYGIPMATNVGDYLIGLGYRLIAGERDALSGEVSGDLVAELSSAHTRLCEGQGAELAWRDALNKRLRPIEALRIHALKTAPAFEAALYAGLRIAGDVEPFRDALTQFARHLGVAFQILNDLDDWETPQSNKRTAGTDALAGRPTILWALALESLDESRCRELEILVDNPSGDEAETLDQVGRLYQQAGVFHKAEALVDKHRQRAREIAERIEHPRLRRLLHYFVDTILERAPGGEET